jgi:hypothetical protein
VWNTTKFEKHLKARLRAELDGSQAEKLLSNYTASREKLIANIFRDIPAIERDLSDHGPDHIANVLTNSHHLLSDDHKQHGLSATDIYMLAMGILFHDVGNLFGRTNHRQKIGEVFNYARGVDPSVRREKTLVMKLARAHTGVASDGTRDTLKELDEVDHVEGESVQLRSIAAVLRFADELAEGPQRTSEFRRLMELYEPDNRLFHDYASITNIRIDRGNERILLTYEIAVDEFGDITDERTTRLSALLSFAYERALKLDQERRYARYYSPSLSPFKATHIAFNFHYHGNQLAIDLPQIQLDDKIVPGDPGRCLPQVDSRYDVAMIVPAVIKAAEEEVRQ